jgi:hypothetical protein
LHGRVFHSPQFTVGVRLAALLGEELTRVASIRKLQQVWGDLLRTFGMEG